MHESSPLIDGGRGCSGHRLSSSIQRKECLSRKSCSFLHMHLLYRTLVCQGTLQSYQRTVRQAILSLCVQIHD
jgi:hypothetical protein